MKLINCGCNKSKFRNRLNPKLKIFKIWFDTLIPFIFLMKLTPNFNFSFKKWWNYRHIVFTPSEALLSSITQNWKKLLTFHDCLPNGVTNFECFLLNLHSLNYHTGGREWFQGNLNEEIFCDAWTTNARMDRQTWRWK